MAVTPAKSSQPRLPGNAEDAQPRMSFGEHLEELRKRLYYAILGSAVLIGVCLWYSQQIIAFLVAPYRQALVSGGFDDKFISTGPAEVVLLYLSVGFKAGIILAAPWIIYQLWLFIAAGLFQRERKIIYRYIGPSVLLFFVGVAFFYFIVLPLTLRFFVDFTRYTAPDLSNSPIKMPSILPGHSNRFSPEDMARLPSGDQAKYPPIPIVSSDPAQDEPATTSAPATGPEAPATQPTPLTMKIWYNAAEGRLKGRIGKDTITFVTGQQDSMFVPFPKLDEYLHFVTFTALVFGGCFELPMVMLILAQIGIVAVATFRKIRKFAYFGMAILAAVLAPSADVMSMCALMIPLILLYEAGIIVSAILVRRLPEPVDDDAAEGGA